VMLLQPARHAMCIGQLRNIRLFFWRSTAQMGLQPDPANHQRKQ